MNKDEKTGLFFGSFNPIHIGHLIIAETMVENTNLKQVWFIISPQNPFKKHKLLLHESDRYDMAKLAISDNSSFKVSDIEFHMPKPTYTIDTLIYLEEKYPNRNFALIMGMDNLKTLSRWKNYEQILKNFEIFVYPRSSFSGNIPFWKYPQINLVEAPKIDISASFIRKSISEKKSIRYLLPSAVYTFIQRKKFYL